MRIPITSDKEPMILSLTLKSKVGKTPIRIRVADANKPGAFYTDRTGYLDGQQTFFVYMPRTPKLLIADVFEPDNEAYPQADPVNFEVVDKKVSPIKKYPNEYAKNELIDCGVDFIQTFSERAGILSAGEFGSTYKSDCGRFRIDYLDAIIDREKEIPYSPQEPNKMVPNPNFGKEVETPARISIDKGFIEVSKKFFLQYPIPQRIAILLHEISHFFINNNQHDELEADMNALKIFLGNGYGPIDANNAFLEVFKNYPSDQNVDRYMKLNNYLMDFVERNNIYK